jgi:predicted PurR-regulated permease PerM
MNHAFVLSFSLLRDLSHVLAVYDVVICTWCHRFLMKRNDSHLLGNTRSMRLSMSMAGFIVFFVLFFPTSAVLASTQSSISEVQRLLSLANSSLLEGNLDSSINSLHESLNIVQELKADEDGADSNNNKSDVLNDSERRGDRADFNSDDIRDSNEIGDNIEGSIVDDNVERSQRCIENAKPGEVCALS